MEQKEAICDVISGAAGIEGGGPARRAGGTTRTADDSGFTPAEIIIGVILLAILATSVVSQALELRQQAQDAAAQTTLRSAVSAARGTYSLTLPGGQNNFVAKNNLTSTASVISGATVNLRSQDGIEAAAVDALSTQEPNINFVTYGSLVPATTTEGAVQKMEPSTTTVWVHLSPGNVDLTNSAVQTITSVNPNELTVGLSTTIGANTKIRAGDLIRLGIKSASGSSFCAILVADSSNGSVSGVGYQSVDEQGTIDGSGADCGAKEAYYGVVTSGTAPALTHVCNATAVTTPGVTCEHQFKEMPGTTGTDTSLSRPVSVSSAISYGDSFEDPDTTANTGRRA